MLLRQAIRDIVCACPVFLSQCLLINAEEVESEKTYLFYALSKEVRVGSIKMNKTSPHPHPHPHPVVMRLKRKKKQRAYCLISPQVNMTSFDERFFPISQYKNNKLSISFHGAD